MERAGFLDKTLLQALIYSLIAHLLLFGTFKIKLNDYQEMATEMTPIDVAVELDEPTTVAGVLDSTRADSSNLYFSNMRQDQIALAEEAAPLEAFSEDELLREEPKEHGLPKMYPLQLKVSESLKKRTLLEDGAALFRSKEPYETVSIFTLSPHHFSIDYKVYVDGASGKIERFERKSELLDKKLQHTADRIISQIMFAPCSEKSYTGSITLKFFCTGDEIRGYMHD